MQRPYDPFDLDVQRDPYPYYEHLREEAPLYRVARSGHYVLSRYEDVRAALRDHETFSSSRGTAVDPGFALGVVGTDPPAHTRLRRIVQAVFTRRAVAARWGERIRAITEELVDRAVAAGTVDAFAALTLPLPVRIIVEILGIPDGDLDEFKHWSDEMVAGITQSIDEEQRRRTEAAFAALSRYFGRKVEERRGSGRGDLITLICEAEENDRLTTREAVHFCILLLIAGNETTTNLLGNAIAALLAQPEEQDRLRADAGLMPLAVEEMLRHGAPSHSFYRDSTREVTYHGTTVPAGARFQLCLASGNRDPRAYPDADRFRADRQPDHEHLAFGSGIHFCLGSMLARLEASVFFEVLLARTRALRAAGEIRYLENPIVRGPIHLPLTLEAHP